MQDNFKDHIEKNIEKFEHSFDVDKGWEEFKKETTPKSRIRIWSVAASITMLLGIVGASYLWQTEEPEQLSEWDEVELFYKAQINDMTRLVRNVTDDESILTDLDEMDRAFAEVKQDLKDDAASEEVIEAMMNHYRLKMEILQKMLDEIKEEDETYENAIIL
ncbi:MAG: hypothetical protein GY816_18820 [Cytophagales bacterium]|nr:hypothetical protein [Cytophagales bacterium]